MAQASVRTAHSKDMPAIAAAGASTGALKYDRRLTDKILAAFNHAYASGAVKTAERLKHVLADVEAQERARYDRRNATAVGQAELWVAFVEARNRYNAVSGAEGDGPKLDAALDEMKSAYRAWSDAV